MRDIASLIAVPRLIERPECRKFLTGRNMSAKAATKLFLGVVNSMTYDPYLMGFGETDEDFKRVRLGESFFNLSAAINISLLDELEQLGKVPDTSALISPMDQRGYILFHEFKHVATRKKHTNRDYGEWLKGLYDECFKPK